MANLSDENNRAKIFARMGQFIAISFALSMILGPTIGAKYGVDKLFLITALLALISIIIIFTKVPNENHITHHKESAKLIEVLKNKELLKLFFSGFMQKGLMSMFFMLTPIIFTKNLHWQKSELWKIYLAALVVGFFALPLGAILAEKKEKAKEVFLISAISITSALILFLINTPITIILAVIVFFFGFNLLEPVLQSFVSKLAKAHEKATALSTSNTIQYLGIFLGGAISGYFLNINALNLLLIITIALGILWIVSIYRTKALKKLKIVEYTKYDKEFIKDLKEEKNVYDFYEKDGKLIVRYI
jgi:predicted MFS family arabinose efflux permease